MPFGSTVTNNWNNAGQFVNYAAAVNAVYAGTPGTRCKIVFMGDSTTVGYGGPPSNYRASSPASVVAALLASAGLPARMDNFVGGTGGTSVCDTRIAFGGPTPAGFYSISVAGGGPIQTQAAGDFLTFTITTPAIYDRMDYVFFDLNADSSMNIALDGGAALAGSPFALPFTGTFGIVSNTINIPLGSHSSVTMTQAGSGACMIESVAFWNSTVPKIEVYNTGSGGTTSDVVGGGSTTGIGPYPGSYDLRPSLVIIDFGINDFIVGNTNTTIVNNLGLMVTGFRSINCDCIIMIPEPGNFGGVYDTQMPGLQSGLYSYSNANNVPIIDLSATYGNSASTYSAAGFLSGDGIHPSALGYADIGARVATLIEGVTPSGPANMALSYAVNSVMVMP